MLLQSTGRRPASTLAIQLFGDFRMRRDGKLLDGPEVGKARELLWYLLLFRDGSHSREALATALWGDEPISVPKKYFRQVLWQLQTALQGGGPPGNPAVLRIASDRVSVGRR